MMFISFLYFLPLSSSSSLLPPMTLFSFPCLSLGNKEGHILLSVYQLNNKCIVTIFKDYGGSDHSVTEYNMYFLFT